MIKGILFDYGGTIDTNGKHWASVLYQAYNRLGIPIDKALFGAVFAHGERQLALHPIIQKGFDFYQVLTAKIAIHFDYLRQYGFVLDDNNIPLIAKDCDALVRSNIENAIPLLSALQSEYRLAIVSNFYGNLQRVLDTYKILPYFETVIESAVVGVRKPDPAIYQMGYQALGLLPEECLIVGDSYKKDIVPAYRNGCRSVWINVEGWEESTDVSYEHKDMEADTILELPTLLQTIQ